MLLHHAFILFLIFFVMLMAVVDAQPPASIPPTLAKELDVLDEVFAALQGARLWPKIWKQNWGSREWSPCALWKNWWGVFCYKDRLISVRHRSGLATGQLPASLSELQVLQELDFANNKLTGTIPPELGNITTLAFLDLSGNKIESTIPQELGNLGQLRFLVLDNNRLVGTIPAALGSGTMALQIEGINLAYNKLVGTIPATFANFKSLLHLRLDHNDLSGTLPAGIVVPTMLWLQLDGNPQLNYGSSWTIPDYQNLIYLSIDEEEKFAARNGGYVPDGGRGAPLRFMAIGDFGDGGQLLGRARELASATALNGYATWLNCSFTATVGDNFYNGNTPWLTLQQYLVDSFEALYTVPALQTPWYPALGNHDKYEQLSYSRRSTRWRQPDTDFRVENITVVGDVNLTLFMYNSISGSAKYGKYRWSSLRDRLVKDTSNYKIVFTHYPIASSGCHKQESQARALEKIQQPATAIFFGHDHHMEAVVHNGVHHFMVGAFARGPCVGKRRPRGFVWDEKTIGGFSFVTVDENLLNVTFVNELGFVMKQISVPVDYHNVTTDFKPATKETILQYATRKHTRHKWWIGGIINGQQKTGAIVASPQGGTRFASPAPMPAATPAPQSPPSEPNAAHSSRVKSIDLSTSQQQPQQKIDFSLDEGQRSESTLYVSSLYVSILLALVFSLAMYFRPRNMNISQSLAAQS